MIDPSAALRQGLLGLGRNDVVRRVVQRAPVTRSVARRFVAGENETDCVQVVSGLVASGRLVTVGFLGEETHDVAQASRARDTYLTLLHALQDRGLTDEGRAEVTVQLSTLGMALPDDGEKVAMDNVRQICEAAAGAGTTVTIDTEDQGAIDSTLGTMRDLRADFPWVGVVLWAHRRRTEADCRDLATAGSRVRLRKGPHSEPESIAYQDNHEVDLSYVRCLKILLEGDGYPMIAGHDPQLIDIAHSLVDKELRSKDSFEFQLLLGIRPDEQQRLVDAGFRLRVHVPYGDGWYGYVMHRLAERPTDAMLFPRSGTTKG